MLAEEMQDQENIQMNINPTPDKAGHIEEIIQEQKKTNR